MLLLAVASPFCAACSPQNWKLSDDRNAHSRTFAEWQSEAGTPLALRKREKAVQAEATLLDYDGIALQLTAGRHPREKWNSMAVLRLEF